MAIKELSVAEINFTHSTPPEFGELKQVADGVYWVRMPLPLGIDHINLWVIEEAESWVIVDTGMNTSATRQHWETILAGPLASKPVRKIIVTHLHPDHIGLAGWFGEKWQIPTYMTRTEYLQARVLSPGRDDFPWETERFFKTAGIPDSEIEQIKALGYGSFGRAVYTLPSAYHRLQDNDELMIGGRMWQVVVGRGHSPEHACLYCDDLKVLISGDQVLPRISSNVSVFAPEPEASPLKDWLESLAEFKDRLPDDIEIFPAHGYPFRGLHGRLDDLIQEHEDKLQSLMEACREPITTVEAMPTLFRREITGFSRLLALGEALAHFHLLRDRGIVTSEDGADGIRRFRRVL